MTVQDALRYAAEQALATGRTRAGDDDVRDALLEALEETTLIQFVEARLRELTDAWGDSAGVNGNWWICPEGPTWWEDEVREVDGGDGERCAVYLRAGPSWWEEEAERRRLGGRG